MIVPYRQARAYHGCCSAIHRYRLTDQGYGQVERRPNRRVWSEVLELEFGVDEADNLRMWELSGERVLTHEEERQRRLAAEQRAEEEASARAAAEGRAEQEARARTAAELRAEEERARREALERELAELRARDDAGDAPH